MTIYPYFEPFPHLVIDDYYSKDELAAIHQEIVELKPHANNPELVGAAKDRNTLLVKKTGSGLFVDIFYGDRSQSKILEYNRKLFNADIVETAVKTSVFYRHLSNCDYDATLLNYYDSGEEYRQHHDKATLSTVWFYAVGDITSGDFEFTNDKYTVPFVKNRLVLFPSCVNHAAHASYSDTGGYRVTIAQFLCYMSMKELQSVV